jgi:hypothetical protein
MTYHLVRTKNERKIKIVGGYIAPLQSGRVMESIERALLENGDRITSFGEIGEDLSLYNGDFDINICSLVCEPNSSEETLMFLEDVSMVMTIIKEEYYTNDNGKITSKILVLNLEPKAT